MLPNNHPNDISENLIEEERNRLKNELNARAMPVFFWLYKFPLLDAFEPFKRPSIIKESRSFVNRQPKLILTRVASVLMFLLAAYIFWPHLPGGYLNLVIIFSAGLLCNIPAYIIQRKLMQDYIALKIKDLHT